MKKKMLLLLMLIASPGCWGEQHHSLSRVDIRASQAMQMKVIEATQQFGERNAFKVNASNNLPREGRQVMQVLLARSDGVLVATSNFMDKDVLETDFYAEKQGADWRSVKEQWLSEMRTIVGNEGQIINVILEEVPTQ
jgi:hypothetical protein